MAKRQIQFTKTCSDCIHESACRIWTDGRFISDTSASVCPNHETVKESSAYLCGVLDERKRKQTNAGKIRAMSDDELANLLTDFSNNGGWVTEIGREICYKRITDWLKQPCEGGE